LGNAERLVDQHGDCIRFLPDFNAWMYWDNGTWALDHLGRVNQLAKSVVRGIYAEVTPGVNAETRAAIVKHARQSEKKNALDHMIDLASKEPNMSIHSAFLDGNPWLFGVRNGVVDLKTGLLRPVIPNDYITKQGNVAYDPEASCPLWEKFLLEIMGYNQALVDFLQRAVGYTLTGLTREQVVFVLHGAGANGKSTFLEIIETLLGDYCKSVASETLMAQRGRTSSGPNEDIARLKGARLTATSETEEGQVLAEALVKRMTGEDTLVARFPYARHSFEFKALFKIWMVVNHKPIIKGDDHAIWRRILLIPFLQIFEGQAQDKSLKQKLMEELPGILNWAIQGCLRWQESGLCPPAEVTDATREYRDEMDLLAEWMEMDCVISPEREASVGELYSSYMEWCITNKVPQMNRKVSGQKLKSKGFSSEKIRGQRAYRGIGVKEEKDYVEAAS
jgi:putative DNA primase/helicase